MQTEVIGSSYNKRFWVFIGKPKLFGGYLPAVVQASSEGIKCVYLPKGEKILSDLFELSWGDIESQFYDLGGRRADSLSIFVANGRRYALTRTGLYGNHSNKRFPASLINLTPNDDDFTKLIHVKPNKIVVELEDLLKNHGVPYYKPSPKQRLFGI